MENMIFQITILKEMAQAVYAGIRCWFNYNLCVKEQCYLLPFVFESLVLEGSCSDEFSA